MQKQSQTNPIKPNLYCVYSWLNSKQSQNKPNLVSSEACGEHSRTVEVSIVNLPQQNRKERFMLTFPENFFNFVAIESVAQSVEQRTFNA